MDSGVIFQSGFSGPLYPEVASETRSKNKENTEAEYISDFDFDKWITRTRPGPRLEGCIGGPPSSQGPDHHQNKTCHKQSKALPRCEQRTRQPSKITIETHTCKGCSLHLNHRVHDAWCAINGTSIAIQNGRHHILLVAVVVAATTFLIATTHDYIRRRVYCCFGALFRVQVPRLRLRGRAGGQARGECHPHAQKCLLHHRRTALQSRFAVGWRRQASVKPVGIGRGGGRLGKVSRRLCLVLCEVDS
mmetsp:Transcript_60292/g.118188  ORF Transcript_60292/g.118188 Transcript_60292/m.118188 type:complete len:247 (+) Transcript_60292:141-881(+)